MLFEASNVRDRSVSPFISLMACFLTACLTMLSWQVAAQNNTEAETESDALEEIVVVGSLARREAQVGELTVPIDLLSQADLANSGEIDLGAGLAKLVASANYSRQSVGDGSLLRAATLRGMSPDQTLVLINGKRRHSMAWIRVLDGVIGYGTGGTDLAAIPSTAISRVEILRDGAAAQYGSDAIAGVINLQMREESEGSEIALHTSTGDAGSSRFGAVVNSGFSLGDSGFLNLTAEWFTEDPIQRNGGNGGLDPNFQDVLVVDSYPEQDGRFVFFNAGIPLDDGSELYAFGGVSTREGRSSGAYRFAYNYWDGLASGNDTWDFVVPTFINFHERNTHSLYPEGFLPYEESSIDDLSLVGGWRGSIASWDVDLSAGIGRNEYNFGVSNTVNASIAAHYLDLNPGATIVDINANAGPTHGNSGGIEFDQTTLNLDLRRSFESARLSAIALGFEYRGENYHQTAGDEASWSCGLPHALDYDGFAVDPNGHPIDGVIAACGFQGYPGYSPTNAQLSDDSRNSQSAYVELESQVTNALTFVTAIRAENYSDAGPQVNGKLAARLGVTDSLVLRGTLSTGFRAPSLSQRRFNSILFVGSETGLTTTFAVNEGHPVARALGVDPLDHENSNDLSLGFLWQSGNFNLSVDAYSTDISGRIVRSQGIGCAGIPACDAARVGTAAFFFNAIDTETEGFDIATRWHTPVGNGVLALSGNIHLNETHIVGRNKPTRAPADRNFDDYFGGWAADLLENGQPQRQANLTLDWENETWGALVRLNQYGATNQHPVDTGLIRVEAATLVDIQTRFELSRFNIVIGIDNVADVLPTKLPKTHLANILWGMQYPNDTPFGLAGRLFFMNLSYVFSN